MNHLVGFLLFSTDGHVVFIAIAIISVLPFPFVCSVSSSLNLFELDRLQGSTKAVFSGLFMGS